MSEFGKIFDVSALNNSTFNLRENLLEHKVLIFKNAEYDIDQYHSLIKTLLKDNNTIAINNKYEYNYLIKFQHAKPGEYGYFARWQIDSCWDIEAADICSLHINNLESNSTYISWVDLEKVRNLLDLSIVDFVTKQSIIGWNALNPKDLNERSKKPTYYSHPALRIHPETKIESVFYSGPSTIGKDNDKWQYYLKYLLEFFQKEDNLFIFKWEKNDIIIWDNRCTSYTIFGEVGPPIQKISIFGSKPVWN
jgi:Taurine catabolism dioxygenase TauD, TfdA family